METIAIIGVIAAVLGVLTAILSVIDFVQKRRGSPRLSLLRRLARGRNSKKPARPFIGVLADTESRRISTAQASRIAEILGRAGASADPLTAWHDYLRRTMLFPFDASIVHRPGEARAGLVVVVRRILGKTSSQDIMVQILVDGKVDEAELSGLEAVDHATSQFQQVSDFRAWKDSHGHAK